MITSRRHRSSWLRLVAVLALLPAFAAPVAHADPPGQGAYITDIQHVNDRWDKVSVYSPAMNTVIVNDVFKAPRSGAPPTFYLLPGIDGGNDLDPGGTIPPGGKAWFGMTDIQGFFANKNVNVVSPPLGGAFSWWTDWVADGSKQYQTYMTRELPPLINKEYHANGKNGVGGLSSTGGTAIDYAIQAPGVFKAVGSYSGFPSVSDPDEAQNISLTLSGGGQSAEAMWGVRWVARCGCNTIRRRMRHGSKALRCMRRRRRAAAWVTSTASLPASAPNIAGGFIERIVADSTKRFADAAAAAGVPIHYVIRPEGSHTWGGCSSRRCRSRGTRDRTGARRLASPGLPSGDQFVGCGDGRQQTQGVVDDRRPPVLGGHAGHRIAWQDHPVTGIDGVHHQVGDRDVQ